MINKFSKKASNSPVPRTLKMLSIILSRKNHHPKLKASQHTQKKKRIKFFYCFQLFLISSPHHIKIKLQQKKKVVVISWKNNKNNNNKSK